MLKAIICSCHSLIVIAVAANFIAVVNDAVVLESGKEEHFPYIALKCFKHLMCRALQMTLFTISHEITHLLVVLLPRLPTKATLKNKMNCLRNQYSLFDQKLRLVDFSSSIVARVMIKKVDWGGGDRCGRHEMNDEEFMDDIWWHTHSLKK